MRELIVSFGVVLFATSAWAGASIKTNVVPFVDVCDSGFCAYSSDICASNSDCNVGTLSEKSKLSIAGDGTVKVKLKGVVDAAGVPQTGDYILSVLVQWKDEGTTFGDSVGIKIPVNAGKGKTEADLSGLTSNADAIFLGYGRMINEPLVPANCPGTGNTSVEIIARGLDSDCYDGGTIGQLGMLAGGKSSFKAYVTPIPDICDGSCNLNGNACLTNADCNFGTLSPKSKASLTGEGRLKVQLKGVVDSSGTAASGNYVLRFVVSDLPTYVVTDMALNVTLSGGKGKVDTDLSSLLTPAGNSYGFEGIALLTPPTAPMDCPAGGNTAAEVAARGLDSDCFTGERIADIGVAVE